MKFVTFMFSLEKLYPHVSSMEPDSGSLAGGTKVIIYGTGISFID